MKYLSDYIEEGQTKLFEELGVFFAFNDAQFKEGKEKYGHLKPEGTKWSSLGMGMFMPTVNVDKFIASHKLIVEKGVIRDLEENGRDGVLRREMANYEICYSDIHDTGFRDEIKKYGFTEEEIMASYKKFMAEADY